LTPLFHMLRKPQRCFGLLQFSGRDRVGGGKPPCTEQCPVTTYISATVGIRLPATSPSSTVVKHSCSSFAIGILPAEPHKMQNYQPLQPIWSPVDSTSHHESRSSQRDTRIHRWLLEVEACNGTLPPPTAFSAAPAPREKHIRQQPKPYARPPSPAYEDFSSKPVRVNSFGKSGCVPPKKCDTRSGKRRSILEIPPTIMEENEWGALSDCRTPSLIEFWGIDDLPHPDHNPLVRFRLLSRSLHTTLITVFLDHISCRRH